MVALTLLCLLLRPGDAASLPWLDESQVRYVTVGTPQAPVSLAYQERGRGEPLLLIHGFGASIYTWRHLAPLLAQRYRVVALDLKGFGDSDKPLDDKYSLYDQAKLVRQFMDKLGLEEVTLIGHSFGGGVALILALEDEGAQRRRVKRLVLLDTIAYRQDIPIFLRLLQHPALAQFGMTVVPTEIQTHAALRFAYYDNSKATYEDALAYARPLKSPGARHALIRTVQQILPEDVDAVSERYSRLTLPVQLIWCEHDRIVPLEIGWRLQGDLPNADFHMLRECGHLPQEELPLETRRVIEHFLAR